MQNDYILVRLSKRPVPCTYMQCHVVCDVVGVNMTDEITDWFNSLAHCLHWNSRHPQASQVDPVFQVRDVDVYTVMTELSSYT